jgi:hypothetical protein
MNICDISMEQGLESFSQTRKTTIIVDVDDKNCLVELTVALKLNQGVRQRCISLPVCFSLVISFAQAKERINKFFLSFLEISVLFALMQKEPKKSSPARSSPSFVGTGCGRAGQRT